MVTDFVWIIEAFDFLGTDQLTQEGENLAAVGFAKTPLKFKLAFRLIKRPSTFFHAVKIAITTLLTFSNFPRKSVNFSAS